MCYIVSEKIHSGVVQKVRKIFTLSFDDGIEQDKRLIVLLKKYRLKCTFNINSGLLGTGGTVPLADGTPVRHDKIAPGEVRRVYEGFEVASHTQTHPLLTQCPPARIIEETVGDYLKLSELVGYPVRGFAYPGGHPNRDRLVTELLRGCTSLAYARTIVSTYGLAFPEDFLEWNPSLHILDARTDELIDRFCAAREDSLLYIWGHSYELDGRGGWERAEEVFARLASIEDAESMTNMEVYTLVQGGKNA